MIYLPIGGWQTKKVMDMGFKTEAFQFRYHLLEKIMQVVEKSKREKFLMIMDMEGLTYKKCLHYESELHLNFFTPIISIDIMKSKFL